MITNQHIKKLILFVSTALFQFVLESVGIFYFLVTYFFIKLNVNIEKQNVKCKKYIHYLYNRKQNSHLYLKPDERTIHF